MILELENKLSSTTPLTSPQSGALKSSSYRVRSKNEASQFGSEENLKQGVELRFSNNIQWYKVYDGTNGDAVSGINKIQ